MSDAPSLDVASVHYAKTPVDRAAAHFALLTGESMDGQPLRLVPIFDHAMHAPHTIDLSADHFHRLFAAYELNVDDLDDAIAMLTRVRRAKLAAEPTVPKQGDVTHSFVVRNGDDLASSLLIVALDSRAAAIAFCKRRYSNDVLPWERTLHVARDDGRTDRWHVRGEPLTVHLTTPIQTETTAT